jgi:hypothetical protein
MLRTVSFFLLFGPLTTLSQTSVAESHRSQDGQITCGPIAFSSQMLDTSKDHPRLAHQSVGIVLHNLDSKSAVLERMTLYFDNETATSGAPFTIETRQKINGKQEAHLVEQTTAPNPVSYVELNSVRFEDGTSWRPNEGTVCEVIPFFLKQ